MQAKGNYRWIVVTLLFFATTINYLDRQVIGLLKDNLAKQFSWSEKDYSDIVMAFTAAYALGLLLFGRLVLLQIRTAEKCLCQLRQRHTELCAAHGPAGHEPPEVYEVQSAVQ